MKLLLVAALATMMALPAMASRRGEKEPGKERGRKATEQSREVREKVGSKGSQTQTESRTAEAQKIAEPLVATLSGMTYKFQSINDGLLPHGINVTTAALRARAEKEGVEASMIQSAEAIIKNFNESLEMIAQREKEKKISKEDAEMIYQLADVALKSSSEAYKLESSADVKADVALVMTMVAQAKMFRDQEIPPSYMQMVKSLRDLGTTGMLRAGEVKKQMGEDLYAKALKNCLNA